MTMKIGGLVLLGLLVAPATMAMIVDKKLPEIDKPYDKMDGAPLVPPIVVELFTSQGCSSCPPADAALSMLARRPRDVIAISEHITYWDRAAWKDPFGSKTGDERQRAYAKALKLDTVFTPQMVVQGAASLTGGAEINNAIATAPRIGRVTVDAARGHIHLPRAPKDSEDVVLLYLQHDATTKIMGGENANVTLTNSNIVRRFEKPAVAAVSTSVPLPAFLEDGVVVLVQDKVSGKLSAAGIGWQR
jgi:hypothetical protein